MVISFVSMTLACFLCCILTIDAFGSLGRTPSKSPQYSNRLCTKMVLQVKDLKNLSVKEALNAVCSQEFESKHLFPKTDIAKKAPTVCTYVIGNPKAFFEKPRMAKAYGVDVDSIDPKTPLSDLAKILPVVYVADVHTEYGTLGYQLNKRSQNTMNDMSPELRSFRKTPIHLGGAQNKGSSFTMVHNKVESLSQFSFFSRIDRKSTRLNSSHALTSRMPSSA